MAAHQVASGQTALPAGLEARQPEERQLGECPEELHIEALVVEGRRKKVAHRRQVVDSLSEESLLEAVVVVALLAPQLHFRQIHRLAQRRPSSFCRGLQLLLRRDPWCGIRVGVKVTLEIGRRCMGECDS